MKKIKGLVASFLITIMVLGIFNIPAYAIDTAPKVSVELSEAYKKWLELPEEERKNTIMPNITSNNLSEKEEKSANSFFSGIKNIWAKATTPNKYILTEEINVPIKHQGSTMECWAFSMTSTLESYLAKSGQQVVPRYSERFIDYSTAKTFLDGENPIAYNREVGQGGNAIVALGHFTNGTGAVLEEDMPFEDNENKINLSEIQGKTPQTRVTEAKVFPNINKMYSSDTQEIKYYDDGFNEYTDSEVTEIRNSIKQHIMEYGAISAMTSANNANYYSNPEDPMHSEAYYCGDTFLGVVDHAITIIGWDDDYSVDNFNPDNKPVNPGAYICLNSYGPESFADGLTYVSYDDVNIEKNLVGIKGADEIESTEKIYQNDFYGYTAGINFESDEPNTMFQVANVFTRDTNEKEYIKEIQLCITGEYTPEVYINPTGDSLTDNLVKVDLKNTDLDDTYNTLEFKEPIEVSGDKFAVVVTLKGTGKVSIGMEANPKDIGTSGETMFDCISANKGESFINVNGTFQDLTEFQVSTYTLANSNLCLKAIATTEEESQKPDDNNNTNTDGNTNTDDNNTNTDDNNTNTDDNNTNTDDNNTNTGDNNTNTDNNNTNTGDNNTNTDDNNTNTDDNNTNTDDNNTNTGDNNTNTDDNNTNTGDNNTNTDDNNTNTDDNNTNTDDNNTNTDDNNTNTDDNNTNNDNPDNSYYYNGTKDTTVASGKLPYTGRQILKFILPVVVIIMLISYANYRKYKDIKK